MDRRHTPSDGQIRLVHTDGDHYDALMLMSKFLDVWKLLHARAQPVPQNTTRATLPRSPSRSIVSSPTPRTEIAGAFRTVVIGLRTRGSYSFRDAGVRRWSRCDTRDIIDNRINLS